MAQKKYESNGRTVLEYNTVYADFGPYGDRAKLIEATIDHSVISLDGQPFMIFATPEFDKSKWWLVHFKESELVKRLVIQPSFQYEKMQGQFCELPTWVAKLRGLTYLKLNKVFVDRLNLLRDTKIKFLEFDNIQLGTEGREMLINDIKKMKYLRGIAYDDSVPLDIVTLLKTNCMNCELYLITEEKQQKQFMHDLNTGL